MEKIIKVCPRWHNKASEKYYDVLFFYPNGVELTLSVPVVYRRTGTSIDDEDVDEYLNRVYAEMDPEKLSDWKAEQELFWEHKPNASVTKTFFDRLSESVRWCCTICDLPSNPNFARRIQDLKEFGYTLATDTNMQCDHCEKNTTHIMLLPMNRGGITGYEVWSPQLRTRIVNLLGGHDVYESGSTKKEGLLPDHKFPEIRWDETTKRESLENLTDEELVSDFQLITNQRNQQKREVCRTCFQTGKRGILFGIEFYYMGTRDWDEQLPRTGKDAEAGCVGCGWYDIRKWRTELNRHISSGKDSIDDFG
jgi:hypothetical protein